MLCRVIFMIVLNVIMLSVVMMRVIILSVVAPCYILSDISKVVSNNMAKLR